MRIGLVKIGEPLPGEGLRPRRMTRLATLLAREGHEVTWWTSDWSHQGKIRRPPSLAASAKAHAWGNAISEASRRTFEAGFDSASEGRRMLDFIAAVAR